MFFNSILSRVYTVLGWAWFQCFTSWAIVQALMNVCITVKTKMLPATLTLKPHSSVLICNVEKQSA